MIRRLVLSAFSLIIIIFIVLMLFMSLQKATVLIIPVAVCIFGITILAGLIIFIIKEFKEKLKKERVLFLDELKETRKYYQGGKDE